MLRDDELPFIFKVLKYYVANTQLSLQSDTVWKSKQREKKSPANGAYREGKVVFNISLEKVTEGIRYLLKLN